MALDVREQDRRGGPSATTLREEASFFAGQTNFHIIAGLLLVTAAARVALGGWRWWDLGVAGLLLAVHPFTEWMIHVFVLHWKPREVLGRRIDPLVSRKHREHHGDPKRIEWIFVPLPVLAKAIPATALVFFLVLPTARLAITASLMGLSILLVYEWTHYLIHSRYRPRSRLYKFIWRAHRLHHFKNENYWFGVTVHAADRVLGTFPQKDEVETSATCRNLEAGSA